MNDQKSWLCFSLFCNPYNWATLVGEGISNWVCDTAVIESYLLGFNYLGGPNIRVSLICPASSKVMVANKADQYFKSYFADKELRRQPSPPPYSKILFMPFPINSIQYGLFSPYRDTLTIRKAISKVIAETFGKEDVDAENIISLAYYLTGGVLVVIENANPLVKAQLVNIATYSAASVQVFEENFVKSRDSLLEVKRDIWTTSESLPNWFAMWTDSCRCFVKENVDNRRDFLQIYSRLSTCIHQQLGLTPIMVEMLNFLIIKTL